jgi:hypothetical protein
MANQVSESGFDFAKSITVSVSSVGGEITNLSGA